MSARELATNLALSGSLAASKEVMTDAERMMPAHFKLTLVQYLHGEYFLTLVD